MGHFADLIVPDRDYFQCAETEIAATTSDLTMLAGKVVYAAADFAALDDGALPPAMPDWSPVRSFGGYGAWAQGKQPGRMMRQMAVRCSCSNTCSVHGHDHAGAWSTRLPVSDLKEFWGALGCACWAV